MSFQFGIFMIVQQCIQICVIKEYGDKNKDVVFKESLLLGGYSILVVLPIVSLMNAFLLPVVSGGAN
jgi:hypothetical protein